MDADVIRIPPVTVPPVSLVSRNLCWVEAALREVRDGEEWILVEHVALEEPLQQFPRHWSLLPVWRSGMAGRVEDEGVDTDGWMGAAGAGAGVSEARCLTGFRH